MISDAVPYFDDIVPTGSLPRTSWLNTCDRKRIRFAYWPGSGRGTVVIFNGRTEYIEKYGDLADSFTDQGYSVSMHDWRGHGLSDRPVDDLRLCHVDDFAEYQLDVDAVLDALERIGAPKPYHLLAHSMGGCIGLRSLHRQLDFRSAVFLGPMWRIYLNRVARNIALALSFLAVHTRNSKSYIFGTNRQNYLHFAKIERNVLTSNQDMFHHLRSQIEIRPLLTLGGPSYGWLRAAVRETATLVDMPPPAHDALVLLGDVERVVDPKAVRIICSEWNNAEIRKIPGGKHELLMEDESIRNNIIGQIAEFYNDRS